MLVFTVSLAVLGVDYSVGESCVPCRSSKQEGPTVILVVATANNQHGNNNLFLD